MWANGAKVKRFQFAKLPSVRKSHSHKSYAFFPSSSLVTDSVITNMREFDHNGMKSCYLKSQNVLSG